MQSRFNFNLGILVLFLIMTLGCFCVTGSHVLHAAAQSEGSAWSGEESDLDPWEPFNENMFEFNRQLDRFILRNIAKAYDAALPDLIQKGIKNAINNVGVIRRLVNNLLQLKMEGAGTEVVRFTLNSTIGVAGLIDIAKEIGIRESDEDTGQTLAAYGIDHGPYLVLPFLPVTTVRDGVGSLVDVALNPLHYIFPAAGINGASTGISALGTVNERSMNLDKFGGVEETVIDLYGAVRNAYFQRRAAAVAE